MTPFTLKPDKNSGYDPDEDPYPARCPCGELILTDAQRRQHIRHCPHYTDGLEPVTIDPRRPSDD
jgi:hypothetical protein